jgi:hypothetical protein
MKAKNSFKTLTITLLITILISSLPSFAQFGQNSQLPVVADLQYGDFIKLQKSVISRNLTSRNFKGSPYLNDDFLLGYIIMHDSIKYNNIPLRYNIFNEQIEFKTGETEYLAIYYPEHITEVVIDGRKFIFADKKRKRFKTKGFYEVLYGGNPQLLVKHNIEFKYEQRALGYSAAKPPRFLDRVNTYFLKTGDEKPIKITKRKQFKTTFKNILTEISEKKSGINKKEDLIEIAKSMENRFQLRHSQKKILEKQLDVVLRNL